MKIPASPSRLAKCFVALAMIGLAAGTAHAHTGQHNMGGGFSSGFLHPFGGWDHLLAMVAVGIWSVQVGTSRTVWKLPVAFISFMIVGLLLGIWLPAAVFLELGILLSVLVLGIFLTMAYRPTAVIAVGLVGGFALFHGCAHGMEMPAHSSGWVYAVGMVLATGLLHGGGILVGHLLSLPGKQWIRAGGVAVLATGTCFYLIG